jgi:hypothetical protein
VRGKYQLLAFLSRVDIRIGSKNRTLSLCLRASAAGVGLRRSTARTYSASTTLALDLQYLSMKLIIESFPSQSPSIPYYAAEISSRSLHLRCRVGRSCAKLPSPIDVVIQQGKREEFLTILTVCD